MFKTSAVGQSRTKLLAFSAHENLFLLPQEPFERLHLNALFFVPTETQHESQHLVPSLLRSFRK